MNTVKICPGCGAPLPVDAPAGLCPPCLLKTEAPTAIGGAAGTAPPASVRPVPGRSFGGYQILRLLGQGGMGEVYEAEHVESGRRVALKVMSHTLASEADRKRFLREGRLAASVNHRNVVYIQAADEIAGVAVIAMELVHGGTLKDRLKREGPLPIPDAVEAALQIIDGLEAAHAAGVLHRDIKPANCFVSSEGTVKVGDFGLSVSTLARGESLLTATGAVLGTPAYASPEQLRGEELETRSDIYSLGATLYHLLTGRTPFTATDFVKLITEVLDKEPPNPRSLRPEIPAELARVVLRCLAKEQKARFQTYRELREALLPFRGAEAVPAPPARRFLAGALDEILAFGPSILFTTYWSFDPLDHFVQMRTWTAAVVPLAFYFWYLSYYAVAEGFWGAGIGKAVFGLRLASLDGQIPGFGKALARVAIYMLPGIVPALVLMALAPADEIRLALARGETLVTDWLWLPLFLLLFVTMRRRNGYAAVHGLASRTRVIVRPSNQTRPGLREARLSVSFELTGTKPAMGNETSEHTSREGGYGPYEVRGTLWRHGAEELLLAFDAALQRQVWVHLRPSSAVAVSAERRDLSRPARLRWLNGGRKETVLWDAYEAVNGIPLIGNTQPFAWEAVRFWLLDAVEEIAAARSEPATAPVLDIERIWLSSRGRLLLLDFPAVPPRAPASANVLADMSAIQRFLGRVAGVALGLNPDQAPDAGGPASVQARVPLHARSFLKRLAAQAFEKIEFIAGNLRSLVSKPAAVTRTRRVASLAAVPVVAAIIGLLVAGMTGFERVRWERAWVRAYPDKPSMHSASQVYLKTVEQARTGGASDHDANLARAFLVNRLGPILTNEAFWANPNLGATFSDSERGLLRGAVSSHLPPNSGEVQEADRVVPRWIQTEEQSQRLVPVWVFAGMLLLGLLLFAVTEFIGGVLFGISPLLRLFGLAIVDADGRPATRGRLLWRWTVVWTGVGAAILSMAAAVAMVSLALLSGAADQNGISGWRTAMVTSAILASLAVVGALVYAARNPARSLQDRLAGTWLVPR